MKTKFALTTEIDDLDRAARDLTDQVNTDFPLLKNTCGILFCASDMDQKGLLKKIKEKFPYDIIGGTSVAVMTNEKGLNEMGICFMVLTADDCQFIAQASDPILAQPSEVEEEVRKLYGRMKDKANEDIKTIFIFPPYNIDLMMDSYTKSFNKIAPNIPVFGGIPSCKGEDEKSATLFNDEVYTDRLVAVAVTGNMKPFFVKQKVSGSVVERKRKVTSARFNTVYKVNDQPFTEYLKEIGLSLDEMTKGNSRITFVANPLLVENLPVEGYEEASFVRALHKIDVEEGSATSIGEIPEGSVVSVCSLRRDDIAEAASLAMDKIKKQIAGRQAEGYDYTTIFVVSCVGRYIFMMPKNSIEADNLISSMPQNMTLGGFYSCGEIAPSCNLKNEQYNFLHNESMVICVF